MAVGQRHEELNWGHQIMAIGTIQKVEEQISRIDAWWKETKASDKTWGREGEYSSKELKASIKELVSDTRAILRSPYQFTRLYALEERQALASILKSLADLLEKKEYSTAIEKLDQLKPMFRGFYTRGTRVSRQYLQQQIDEVHHLVPQVKSDLEEIDTYKSRAETDVQKVAEFVQQADVARERLEEQQVAANAHEEKSQKSYEELEQKLKEADGLIESAKQALGYKTAEGISAAFTARYNEYDNRRSWLWLAGAAGFLVALVILVVFEWDTAQGLAPMSLVYRFAVLSAVFSGAYFCAAQYKKQKNVQEDYGYKAVLAKSLVGFLEKLPEDVQEVYLAQVLSEIHKDPMRKIHEVDDTPAESLVKRMFARRGKSRNVVAGPNENSSTGSG